MDTKPIAETQDLEINHQQGDKGGYRPRNKREREVRRKVYERYYFLRGDPIRTEMETDWDLGDKEYHMYFDPPDPDDWRADIHLPDAFASIQVQMQETLDRRSRPVARAVEDSDEPLEEIANATLSYNMDQTEFDYQFYLAKLAAAIRGHAFLREYWRVEKRRVKMPSSVDSDGKLEYKEEIVTDCDDTYTEYVPNEFVFPDERAYTDDDMIDYVRREIVNIDEFHRIYDNKPGFVNQQFVVQGGQTVTRSFFRFPKDINNRDVEILHYQNKKIDAYWVVANNVMIYDGPLPNPHKELDISSIRHYVVPNRFWGMGIPKVMHYLSEERRTIRNLTLDRQKLHLNKMFLHNSAFDIDDEDTVASPGKIITVDTQGQPISQAIIPLEYGDVPTSYFKTEEIMREDIVRATGIDDRLQGVETGSTATQAAILKESSLKRVNMVATLAEMTTIRRIGKLKWANIQFFYSVPRIERITEDNKEREQKVYKTIVVQGKKFEITDQDGNKALRMQDVQGSSAFEIKGRMADYLNKSYDIIVDAEAVPPPSKALQQSKVTEMLSIFAANPALMAVLDPNKVVPRVLKVNDESPKNWIRGTGINPNDMMMLAESENMIMAAGQPLAGTENATSEHTLVHLMYTKTEEFGQLPIQFQQIISNHIMQEHDANPATGSAADLMSAGGMGGPTPPKTNINPAGMAADTTEPQVQTADVGGTNFTNPA